MYSSKTTMIVVGFFVAFVLVMVSLPSEINFAESSSFKLNANFSQHFAIFNNLPKTWENNNNNNNNIELSCWAVSSSSSNNNELKDEVWHDKYVVKNQARANITFPKAKDTDKLQVYCNYSGSNGCWAERLKIFSSPSHDNYFCSTERYGCIIEFGEDGSVEKRYDNLIEKTFLGYVPVRNNTRKNCMGWFICLPKSWNGVIGEKSCCQNLSNNEC